MTSVIRAAQTVGQLIQRRLRELDRDSAELAEVALVPADYIDDLIAGRRPPPLPSRTDIYQRMTSFLGLGRNELAAIAQAERKSRKGETGKPTPAVRRLLLDLCQSETATMLTKARTKEAKVMVTRLMDRLLNVAQMEARRLIDDPAAQRGVTALSLTTVTDARFAVLEFLDATVASLTPSQVAMFIQPRIAEWDADAESGVLKVVLRSS